MNLASYNMSIEFYTTLPFILKLLVAIPPQLE